jgi:hypothetical protein
MAGCVRHLMLVGDVRCVCDECVLVSVSCLTWCLMSMGCACLRVCVSSLCMCVRAGLHGECVFVYAYLCMRGGDDDDDTTSVTLLLAVGVLCVGACCSCV